MIADATALIGELAAVLEPGPAAVAFDGDGTLWRGDVGEDLFEHALGRGLLREPAQEELARVARRYGLDAAGTATEIAQTIYEGWRQARVPERTVCEVMTWGYAGWSPENLAELAREVLGAHRLRERYRVGLRSVVQWARERGLRSLVVSASPSIAVEEAAAPLGFSPAEIIAGRACVGVGGSIEPSLAAPVPYAEQKREQLLAALGDVALVGAFGDNVFDLEMLGAARMAVAVAPKAALAERLGELENVVVFPGGQAL